MSKQYRQGLQSSFILAATLGAGLLTAWLIVTLQKPDPPTDPWWVGKAAQQEQSSSAAVR